MIPAVSGARVRRSLDILNPGGASQAFLDWFTAHSPAGPWTVSTDGGIEVIPEGASTLAVSLLAWPWQPSGEIDWATPSWEHPTHEVQATHRMRRRFARTVIRSGPTLQWGGVILDELEQVGDGVDVVTQFALEDGRIRFHRALTGEETGVWYLSRRWTLA